MKDSRISLDAVANSKDAVRRSLEDAHPALLGDHPIADYIAELDRQDPYHGYRYVSAEVQEHVARIANAAGTDGVETYHRLVLLELISSFESRLADQSLPESVHSQTCSFVSRVLSDIDKPRPGYFLHENDRFAKDLGVCRLRLVVGGPEVVQLSAGFPRSYVLRQPWTSIPGRLSFLLGAMKGFRPVYETHMDRRLIAQFSPEGYEHLYRNLAAMLDLNPEVKGVMFGATWFVDPALESISPELSYLRTVPLENGAKLLPAPTTEMSIKDATRWSPVRQKMFDEGTYQPRNFIVLWPRQPLIEWAGRA